MFTSTSAGRSAVSAAAAAALSLLLLAGDASALSAASPAAAVRKGLLGPPEPLSSLEVVRADALEGSSAAAGDYPHVEAYRVTGDGASQDTTIVRLSRGPDVFLLRGFLSAEECEALMGAARAGHGLNRGGGRGMEAAGTTNGASDTESRTKCDVSWLPSGHDATTQALATAAGSLLTTPELRCDLGLEFLQVLRYERGGEFVAHVDPVPGAPRCLTVLYYLNGQAGTWFPLANTNCRAPPEDRDRDDDEDDDECDGPRDRMAALRMVEGLEPGVHGLLVEGGEGRRTAKGDGGGSVVRVRQGDAVAFYSYRDDGSGQVDWRTMHAGLPCEAGSKWVANHWFHANCLKRRTAHTTTNNRPVSQVSRSVSQSVSQSVVKPSQFCVRVLVQ